MATAAETHAVPVKKGGKKKMLIIVVVSVLSLGSGAAIPLVLPHKGASPTAHEHDGKEAGRALVTFGDAVVNLSEGRLTRFLRVKLILVVDEHDEKTVTELLAKKKPFLKSWLISYLSDRSLEEVAGGAAQGRCRREIRDQFNALLFPDGSEKVIDILFEEFNVS